MLVDTNNIQVTCVTDTLPNVFKVNYNKTALRQFADWEKFSRKIFSEKHHHSDIMINFYSVQI